MIKIEYLHQRIKLNEERYSCWPNLTLDLLTRWHQWRAQKRGKKSTPCTNDLVYYIVFFHRTVVHIEMYTMRTYKQIYLLTFTRFSIAVCGCFETGTR